MSPRNAIPLVLAAIAVLGAFFHERWRWSATHRRLEHRVGVGPVAFTSIFALASLRSLRVSGVPVSLGERPGGAAARKAWLDLRRSSVHPSFVDGQSRVHWIDYAKGPRSHELIATAREIARFADVHLDDQVRRQTR